MPQIGWFEILIVVLVAIIILGPKDFPIMLKKVGAWVSSFKNYFTEMQKDISEMENSIVEDDLIEKNLTNLKKIKKDE